MASRCLFAGNHIIKTLEAFSALVLVDVFSGEAPLLRHLYNLPKVAFACLVADACYCYFALRTLMCRC